MNVTSPLRWLGTQWTRLKEEGLAARTLALGKKLLRPVLRGCFRFAGSRPRLKRAGARLARNSGLYGPLHSLYLRLSGKALPVAILDHELLFNDDAEETSPARMPGKLTLDELLSRIRAELADPKKQGQPR